MSSLEFVPETTFAFAIPFPDLAELVDEWRERTCTSKPSHGAPPHVSLLIPAPADVDGAAEALAGFSRFDVTFERFGRFEEALWLAPDPAEPFVAMTEALVQRFPSHPPYEGLFEEITPHLTVAQGDDLNAAQASIADGLPMRTHASRVVVFEQLAPDRWCEAAEFAL